MPASIGFARSLALATCLTLFGTELVAQSATCGDDSAKAENYRAHLRTFQPGDKAREVSWSTQACMDRLALVHDSTLQANDTVFAYVLTGAGRTRYAVISTWPDAVRKRSEWTSGVCFYDSHWKQLGACLAI